MMSSRRVIGIDRTLLTPVAAAPWAKWLKRSSAIEDVDADRVSLEGVEARAFVVVVLGDVELEGDVFVDGDGGLGCPSMSRAMLAASRAGMAVHVKRMRRSRSPRKRLLGEQPLGELVGA